MIRKSMLRAIVLFAVAVFLLVAGYALYVRAIQGRGTPIPQEAPPAEEQLSHLEDYEWGSYVFSLELTDVLDSEVYHFSGNRIELSMGSYREGSRQGASEYLTVELHRMSAGFFDTLVGTQTLSRWGTSTAIWDNLEEGDYYFRFVKDDDGQKVIAENVSVTGYVVYD